MGYAGAHAPYYQSVRDNLRYVDSEAGNDAHDGASPATAFRTLAHAAQSSSRLMLACGSRFREELTGLPVGSRVRAYGAGARPIIDGRDVAANAAFVKTVGQTSVYEIAWSHAFAADGGKTAHRVWEAGVMLTRAATLAACDSTSGSFYAAAPTTGGPDTVYVHPAGGTSPITNGLEYTLTKRRWAVQLYDLYNQANVIGVETIGNAHADGSLCVDGYVEDCVARDGRIHNAFVLGTAVNCQALACELGVNSTMFISYTANGFGGGPSARTVLYVGCLADAQTTAQSVTGFFAHTGSNGVDDLRVFSAIEFRECRVVGCDQGWGGSQSDCFVAYKCTADNVLNAYGFQANPTTGTALILGGSVRVRPNFSDGGLVGFSTGAARRLIVHGVKCYMTGGGFGPILIAARLSTVSFTRCTLACSVGGLVKFQRGNVSLKRCVVAYGNLCCTSIGVSDAQLDAYDTDSNCFWTPAVHDATFQGLLGGTQNFGTLAAWHVYLNSVALGTGRDANSIAADPLVADAANGDFTIGNLDVLNIGAGAEPNEEDDPELQALWAQYRISGSI